MLFNIARALRSLGHAVTIVGPSQPGEVMEAAADEGFDIVRFPASTRKQYMAQLRIWHQRNQQGLLWCNGLVPSFATAGQKNRVAHLHQIPQGKLRWLVKPAQKNALKTLLPSEFATQSVKNAEVFPNWVRASPMPLKRKSLTNPVSLGFLGRPSILKGTDTLARSVAVLNGLHASEYEMVIAGASKFIPESDQQELHESLTTVEKHTRYLGWVEPAELFKQVDILVVPSKVPESFGLVAAEAMSARVPLLVSDAGALPEVVGQDYPWIFERNNVDSLAQKILEVTSLLTNDAEKTEEIVNAAYWRWQENFSPEAGKARLQQLLSTLI